jgi:hypothetical protein
VVAIAAHEPGAALPIAPALQDHQASTIRGGQQSRRRRLFV